MVGEDVGDADGEVCVARGISWGKFALRLVKKLSD